MCVIKSKLLSYREDGGGYITYIFRNLDENSWDHKYIMTVRFPNWNCPLIKVGDQGYLEFKEVKAGEDTWWDRISNSNIAYKYSNIIFINFIHEKEPESLAVILLLILCNIIRYALIYR